MIIKELGRAPQAGDLLQQVTKATKMPILELTTFEYATADYDCWYAKPVVEIPYRDTFCITINYNGIAESGTYGKMRFLTEEQAFEARIESLQHIGT